LVNKPTLSEVSWPEGEYRVYKILNLERYAKEDKMRLLYIVTKGMNDPTLASVPLHIAANGSLEVGQDVSVVLAGDATDLVIGDNAQRLEGVGVPPARELLNKLNEHEVPVYV
jgi:predicted peroxiredoxin